MPIKKRDFIEVDYTGKLKDSGEVFDTTKESVAKEAGIHNPDAKYRPFVVCVGEQQMIPGLDEFVVGKEPGSYTVELPAEKAFGKKDAKLMRMIPMSQFKKQNIQPVPGLQLNIDDNLGTVRTVTGGRVVVDFNHPLSGKDMIYELTINKIVTDKQRIAESLMRHWLGIDVPVAVRDGKVVVDLPAKLPEQVVSELQKKVGELAGFDVEFQEMQASTPERKRDSEEKE